MRGPECGSHVKTRHFRTGGAAAPRENSEPDLDFFLLPRWRAPRSRTARRRGIREGGSSWTAKTRGFSAVVLAAREKPVFSARQTSPKTRAFRHVGARLQTARENTALPRRAGRRSAGKHRFPIETSRKHGPFAARRSKLATPPMFFLHTWSNPPCFLGRSATRRHPRLHPFCKGALHSLGYALRWGVTAAGVCRGKTRHFCVVGFAPPR